MATTPQYVAAYEGFDIYPSGALAASHPWYIINSALNATINTTGGVFGGGALTLPTAGAPSTLTIGTDLQFPSTMVPIRGNTAAGGQGVFSISGWLNVTSATATQGPILGIGTSQSGSVSMPILGLYYSSTSGLNIQFIGNVNSANSSPVQFAITTNTQYWVTVTFAYYSTSSTASTATLLCSAYVNGAAIFTDKAITWSSDLFSAGQTANRLKFYGSSTVSYFWDDVVIQAVSNADSSWPVAGGSFPTPETIPALTARRIYTATATGNGTTIQMTPSGAEPNWQSATDTTGTNYVTATATGQTDTYKWSVNAGATDIRAVQIRGNANRYQNLVGSYAIAAAPGTPINMPVSTNGPSRYVAVVENDGTNMWTVSSIQAGEFGQTSR